MIREFLVRKPSEEVRPLVAATCVGMNDRKRPQFFVSGREQKGTAASSKGDR